MPMLAPQQVIFVSDVEAWERLGDDSRDALVKQISAYLDNPAPFSVLVFRSERVGPAHAPRENVCGENGSRRRRAFERSRGARRLAVPLAFEMAGNWERSWSTTPRKNSAEILNGELAAIRTEVEKLSAYAGERETITRADVELLVISPQKYEVWDLADMLA